jgi:hypothetical protein
VGCQLLAIAAPDLQLPSPASPARQLARLLPFCLLSPSVPDRPGPFPESGYLLVIRAGVAEQVALAGQVSRRLCRPSSPRLGPRAQLV